MGSSESPREAPPIVAAFLPSTADPNTPSSFSCQLYSNGFSDLPMLETISSPCSFDAEIFEKVMVNLIRNPNITSSHLFRADIFYDSAKDTSFDPDAYTRTTNGDDVEPPQISTFIKHMRAELKPRALRIEGFELRQTMVRQMVPRNTKLDRALPQTCHLFRRQKKTSTRDTIGDHNTAGNDSSLSVEEDNLVVYIPHVSNEEEIPWYHPKVKALCFLHTSYPKSTPDSPVSTSKPNTISLHISPFTLTESASTSPPPEVLASTPERLTRTLSNLLTTIHRHGTGQQKGYQKRVHHDRIISQAKVQDTYTRLKNTYAKDLLDKYWQEVTDATKGIFEDLGIAAFCIELWKEMYAPPTFLSSSVDSSAGSPSTEDNTIHDDTTKQKPPFPGFVDMGCGNAVLDFILLSEGYKGWGFDARARKTWAAFPSFVSQSLKELVLVPSVFAEAEPAEADKAENTANLEAHITTSKGDVKTHNGLFPAGTFIISNHADELTPWTPLIAYLNDSPFVSIPCCSHDLTGARHRYPPPVNPALEAARAEKRAKKGNKQNGLDGAEEPNVEASKNTPKASGGGKNKAMQPSAYSTLCSAVARLAIEAGYEPEQEVLRIPSTRNVAIIGRRRVSPGSAEKDKDHPGESRDQRILRILRQELPGHNIADVAREWRERAAKIAGSNSKIVKH